MIWITYVQERYSYSGTRYPALRYVSAKFFRLPYFATTVTASIVLLVCWCIGSIIKRSLPLFKLSSRFSKFKFKFQSKYQRKLKRGCRTSNEPSAFRFYEPLFMEGFNTCLLHFCCNCVHSNSTGGSHSQPRERAIIHLAPEIITCQKKTSTPTLNWEHGSDSKNDH